MLSVEPDQALRAVLVSSATPGRSSVFAAGRSLGGGLTKAQAKGNMKIAALLNPDAGLVLRLGKDGVRQALTAAFEAQCIHAETSFVPCETLRQATEQALSRAQRGEIDAVVVGGGDGTVRTIAGVLAGTGVPLGLLPLGTLNHFAKDLGIPMELDAAAAVIAGAAVRAVDVAEVNGEVFINNSSIGIYPYMVLDRERRRASEGRQKWTAMILAFLRMLRHFPRRRLRVTAEGRTQPYRTPCLFIGNNQYSTDLFALGKRERLDGGELWLYVVKQRRPLGFLLLALRTALGRLEGTDDLEMLQVRAAEIRSHASRVPVALDGEVETLRPPLRYRARPRALHVLAPAPAPG
jgi:diacylglycerol kinase family enzyme